MQRVLLTGSSGYIGRTLCEAFAQGRYVVRAAVRADRPVPAAASEHVVVDDVGPHTDWDKALQGVDVVCHLAALAHVLQPAHSPRDAYFRVNAAGTMQLATAAVKAGVKRFVYLSTIKVNGEATLDKAYTASDEPNPSDDYAVSKWHGEEHLARIADQSTMQWVVARPPLVYGPGVRANFLRLMRWVDRGIPLPLGAIDNRRSLVSIWNLCDLLVTLSRHPRAHGRAWLVSDGLDLSTPELIRRIAAAMGRPIRLVSVPVGLLRSCMRLIGRQGEIARLCDSLSVDMTHTRKELEWRPPLTIDESLTRTVRWYLSQGSQRAP